MARQKTYEPNDVIEKAMRAFWEHGYDATSMKTLVQCTGLNPGSIYAAFGDKRNLFQLALTHYEDMNRMVLDAIEAKHSPRHAILALFEHMIKDASSTPGNCGCFVVNSILEIDTKDPDINKALQKGLDQTQQFLRRMIVEGQKAGEIRPELDPEQTALLLQSLICGTRIIARGRQETSAIRNALSHVESIL